MAEEDNKILIYNFGEKSMKHPFIISLPNDLQKSYTEEKISMKCLVIQCLLIVPLILQKIS